MSPREPDVWSQDLLKWTLLLSQAVSQQANFIKQFMSSAVLVTKCSSSAICFENPSPRDQIYPTKFTYPKTSKNKKRWLITHRSWCYYLQNIYSWNFPSQNKTIWIVRLNVPLWITDHTDYWKTHEFHLLFCVSFLTLSAPQKNINVSPQRNKQVVNSQPT